MRKKFGKGKLLNWVDIKREHRRETHTTGHSRFEATVCVVHENGPAAAPD